MLGPDGKYQPVPVSPDSVNRSTIIPGRWLRPQWLWADEKPEPQLTFAEIVGPERIIEALQQLLVQSAGDRPVNGKADR